MDVVVRHNPHVSFRSFDGEAVVVDTQRNVVRMLNEVGSRIWELIDGERNSKQIARCLVDEYDVTLSQAEEEVNQFIDLLEQRHLLSR